MIESNVLVVNFLKLSEAFMIEIAVEVVPISFLATCKEEEEFNIILKYSKSLSSRLVTILILKIEGEIIIEIHPSENN